MNYLSSNCINSLTSDPLKRSTFRIAARIDHESAQKDTRYHFYARGHIYERSGTCEITGGKIKEKEKKRKEGRERWRCRRRDVCRLSREPFSLAMTREDKENRFNFPNALAASSSASRPILRLFPPFPCPPTARTFSNPVTSLYLSCACLFLPSLSLSSPFPWPLPS